MSTLIDPSPRKLGQFSANPIALGCWRLVAMSATEAEKRIEAAIESGMNLIDNADVYGLDWGGSAFGEAEAILGEVIKKQPTLREKMILATKGGIIPGTPYNSSSLIQACEASLKRLNVEQIDLYQIHRPDLLAHPAEVAQNLQALLQQGKIAEVGVSNFQSSQIDALAAHLDKPIVSHQPEYSALHLAPLFDGTFDHAMQHNLCVLAWSPLAGGQLANTNGLNSDLKDVLQELAEREGIDIATLALAFCLAHPAKPIAIVGSTNIDRIKQAGQALKVRLSREDVYRVIQASMQKPLP